MSKKIRLHKRLNRSLAGDAGINIILVLIGMIMILPIVYIVSSALKPLDEIWMFPPRFFVQNPTLKNFSDLFRIMSNSVVPFARYVFNTIFVSVVGTTGHVIIASMCAYVFAKHQFPGSKLMFNMVVTALMFTASVTAIPNFLVMSALKIVNTYYSLILPAFASSLGLYLMKQFMEQMIPNSVLESARIDGAGEWKIFWKIAMSMVRPAWLTLIVFSFQSLWNTGPTVFVYSEKLKTLNYALNQILAGGVARAGAGAAAVFLSMIVPIVLFVIVQSNVVETMSTSGMKD